MVFFSEEGDYYFYSWFVVVNVVTAHGGYRSESSTMKFCSPSTTTAAFSSK